ncbi:hypothetical protein ACH6CV_16760 [Bacillota bacterium Meth-B3]
MMLDVATIKEMRHAIGLDYQNPKRGKYEAYRNYAQYNSPHPIWEPLVEAGLAKCHKYDIEEHTPYTAYRYSLTREGLDLMEAMIGAKITVRR